MKQLSALGPQRPQTSQMPAWQKRGASDSSLRSRSALGDQLQLLRKLFINSTKAAVGKNGDYVSRAQLGSNEFHNGVSIGNNTGTAALLPGLGGYSLNIKALRFRDSIGLKYVGHNHIICYSETLREIGLKHVAAQRIGTRLQNRPKFRSRIASAQSGKSRGNRGGVVREIVNDGDAVNHGANFKAPFYALKCLQPLGDLTCWNTAGCCNGCGRSSVPHVVFPRQ